ncbi:hypothetical protein AVEN_252983-1 [Araneus ventricosus]|uniref:Uncharacterized protein n=1 Tax=Araneus ventricosus TaxID=182803 RepID=A0A4Y2M694_ARAVE|nr:hypothetical protein AVEN_252983-1 [Araneus ventricosus]
MRRPLIVVKNPRLGLPQIESFEESIHGYACNLLVVGIQRPLHYATECIYTVSWHMRKPAPNFEQEWLKRVASQPRLRQKSLWDYQLHYENRDLFRPPKPQHPSESN